MAQEVEIKLEVSPAALERLEASPWFGKRAGAVRREEQRSVYFDTPQLELRDEGVTLRVRHIGDRRVRQGGLFEQPHQTAKRERLMKVLDTANQRYGNGILGAGHAGMARPARWAMKRLMTTPAYTTSWDDLVLVQA